MAKKQQFTAPAANPYDSLIQSTTPEQAPEEPKRKTRPDDYRFAMRVSAECGAYLREMAWRKTVEEHRQVTITELVQRIIEADMQAHPEWKETVDILNTSRK